MYELVQVGKSTYYIKSPTNMGIYKVNENDIYLIDSGNNKEVGRKVLKIIKDNNWNLIAIINTHSNADHVNGNSFIQARTNCKIISTDIENVFIKHPILELSYFYGGNPFKELKNRFLLAEVSNPTGSIENSTIEGLEFIDLKGHSFDMFGVKTSDGVYFLADSIFSEEVLSKHQLILIYNLRDYLNTLCKIEDLKGELFIPSHCEPFKDPHEIVRINRDKAYEVINLILDIVKVKTTFEDILKGVLDHYGFILDPNTYVLLGSTVKAYLTYLYEEDKIKYLFVDNRMHWERN